MAMIMRPMRLLGIGAIVKLAVNVLFTFLKAVYRTVAYLRMRLMALYLAVALLLVWADVVKKPSSAYTTLLILGILLFLLSLTAFARSISGGAGEKKTKEPKQKKKGGETAQVPDGVPGMPAFVLTPVGSQGGGTVAPYTPLPPAQAFEGRGGEEPVYQAKEERPRYYRVAQNPKYVMAEYSDRVELFYDAPNGLKYVRTDYKN